MAIMIGEASLVIPSGTAFLKNVWFLPAAYKWIAECVGMLVELLEDEEEMSCQQWLGGWDPEEQSSAESKNWFPSCRQWCQAEQ